MSLLGRYDGRTLVDEAIAADGSVRERYAPVLAALERMGADALSRRAELRRSCSAR